MTAGDVVDEEPFSPLPNRQVGRLVRLGRKRLERFARHAHQHGMLGGVHFAVGYLDFAGNVDFCIAIRTVIMSGRKAYVQAGAGIVADSIPENEYQECLNKTQALVRAVELARSGE